MEVLFLRFTHLEENIFEILSNENLVKCREVGIRVKHALTCSHALAGPPGPPERIST
jgi:hypothetical protein